MLAGIVVATETGLEALVFYLAAYSLMNLAVFVAIVARERETEHGDDIGALEGIGTRTALARLAADDRRAGAGRAAGDLGLHRQALPDRGRPSRPTTPGSGSRS